MIPRDDLTRTGASDRFAPEKAPCAQGSRANGFSRLDTLFHPRSVAVVGASSGIRKWGYLILCNILAGGYTGAVYPINPKETNICGLPCFRSLRDVPGTVDLVLITTPANTAPDVLKECTEKGVGGVVLISSGFSETDDRGKQIERDIVDLCQEHELPLVGPNTMGIISTHSDLYATGAHARPRKGSIAFVSQSGNLGVQLMHWATGQGIGISLFIGSGNEGFLNSTDFLEYLESDPATRTIIMYLEGIEDGRRFVQVARRVSREKPIIALNGGRTDSGKMAAASHTGSMAGSTRVFNAACRQAGVLLARKPSELLDLSMGFSSLPLTPGNRVGIVSLGGGWGVVTCDACREAGLEIPPLPEHIVKKIDRHLPPFWSRANPIDLVGTLDMQAPIVAVEELVKWDGIDAVICLGIIGRKKLAQLQMDSTRKMNPEVTGRMLDDVMEAISDYEAKYAEHLLRLMEAYHKPIVGVSLAPTGEGSQFQLEGCDYSGVFFPTPESAVNVLAQMARRRQYLNRFEEKPARS
ncbi:MAG: CoA-binding protein [Deltaproteobacteria bacterium]|nr:CoA-binding protein [Deltaproteobacteria bacterium]